MPYYAIMRFAKQKSAVGALEAHHERTKEKYASNPDINIARSKNNFHIVTPAASYKREMDQRIADANCRLRKDSVRFVDTLITASPEFFKRKKPEEVQAFFQEAVRFLAQKIGKKNIFAAVVHMDEKTPHMHLCFTPITEDGRLSAKEIIGNRAQLTKWQDEFFAHMVNRFQELERGESASVTGRRHIPTHVFKQAVHLSRQARQINAMLTDINPLNAGKRKEEIRVLLHKFFPNMERLEAQLRKYKKEILLLEQETISLKDDLDAAKPRVKDMAEANKLRQEVQFLREFYAATPKEYKDHYQEVQKQKAPKYVDRDGRG